MTATADVHVATDLADAIAVLAANPSDARAVAGGTDVLIDRRLGRDDSARLVDLSRVDALRGIVWDDGVVRIGTLTTIRALELDEDVRRRASAISDAAHVLGSVQIRNMATVGGNVCHATPSADMPPALLVHDGRAEIAGAAGTRALALTALFSGPGTTTLAPGELLTSIHAHAPADSGSCYLRQTVRWSMDLAGVGAAAYVRVSDGSVADARVALGAVAPVPLLVSDAAAPVVGRPFDVEAARSAGRIAAAAARPITDARGTAEYRRRVVEVLVARALHLAWRRATGTWRDRVPPHGRLDEETA